MFAVVFPNVTGGMSTHVAIVLFFIQTFSLGFFFIHVLGWICRLPAWSLARVCCHDNGPRIFCSPTCGKGGRTSPKNVWGFYQRWWGCIHGPNWKACEVKHFENKKTKRQVSLLLDSKHVGVNNAGEQRFWSKSVVSNALKKWSKNMLRKCRSCLVSHGRIGMQSRPLWFKVCVRRLPATVVGTNLWKWAAWIRNRLWTMILLLLRTVLQIYFLARDVLRIQSSIKCCFLIVDIYNILFNLWSIFD